ncbi:hypothetical protein FIBSPDRAFT_550112 [Athelia psychrophila]|uniref:Uncharacterized protein n=1 Tax=Athelia psychrophila TaxID=1759441 RepID=A0A166USR7_9AGAM|nr:hypothetical protein FIBSPDRAFT_550112 [Fibularhizoctonia sp. CBS 109695]
MWSCSLSFISPTQHSSPVLPLPCSSYPLSPFMMCQCACRSDCSLATHCARCSSLAYINAQACC